MNLPPLLAHVGHWWTWVIYAVPVLIVLAASVHALLQQRRENGEREPARD